VTIFHALRFALRMNSGKLWFF